MDKRTVLLQQAHKFFKAGKIDATIVKYKEILALKPDDLKVRQIVGDLELKINNTVEAIRQFEWIADYYLKDGFFTKSIAMYKRISRIDPNYQEAFFKLAELYTKQGLTVEAKQIYLDLAEEYKRQMNQKRALDMYKKILEFDRNNIKMRLLLADSYLKEGLQENAVEEYLTAADILIGKKEFDKVEELVDNLKTKTSDSRLTEKLLKTYALQGKVDEAIQMLLNLGEALYKNTNLLKMLGELLFDQDRIDEAEAVFKRVAEIDPNEAEIVLKLGRVYLQREEYKKTFDLFEPIIEVHVNNRRYDEAASFLRFIIASNNSFLPALFKLAEIFEVSGKTNNLIALYESMLPIFEKSGAKDNLIKTYERLIKLSDKPFVYEEQLSRIQGKDAKEEAMEEAQERAQESINFNLRMATEAISESDFVRAEQLLIKTKQAFPKNLDVQQKLYALYQKLGQTDKAVAQGKDLLEQLRNHGHTEEYNQLLSALSELKPEDDHLAELSGNESTNIEIDFDQEEFEDQLQGMADSQVLAIQPEPPEGDVLLLSEENTVNEPDPLESSKTLSSVFSELDFYINDGYFGDAEKLILEMKKKYPENSQLITRIERFKKESHKQTPLLDAPASTLNKAVSPVAEPFISRPVSGAVRELELDLELDLEPAGEQKMGTTDNINYEFDLDSSSADKSSPSLAEELKLEVEFDSGSNISKNEDPQRTIAKPAYSKTKSSYDIQSALFEIERTVKKGTGSFLRPEEFKSPKAPQPPIGEPIFPSEEVFELGSDSLDNSDFSLANLTRDPSESTPPPQKRTPSQKLTEQSILDTLAEEPLELDNLLSADEEPLRSESPFQEISHTDIPFEQEEDLLGDELLSFENPNEFLTIEDYVSEELQALAIWMKELEKQRTSTIEKNMMEIFDAFKKGVDEKIGTEDYDTRYNLGIAYKEMGLIEEAIHEFLIAAKHPLKFFDSAGLLGMCLREKGMHEEATTWFERALKTIDRQPDEYLAIKYELVQTHKINEDYERALQYIREIRGEDQDYRDIAQLYHEVKSLSAG